ncbi:MAG: hypothetical protein CMO81_09580 [Waddliaceae bacterium]|nr:hypothetical protein [Waddliaceae bacterium]
MEYEDPLDEFRIKKEDLKKLHNKKYVLNRMRKGDQYQDLFGYSDETMMKFYTKAKGLFDSGEYKKAADAFFFLGSLNPTMAGYWFGQGLAEQRCERYQKALLAYGSCVAANPVDPRAYLYLGECLYKLGYMQQAEEMFLFAIPLAEPTEFKKVKKDLEKALAWLKGKK